MWEPCRYLNNLWLPGEGCASEAVNAAFDAWVAITQTEGFAEDATLRQHVEAVLMAYIECRMAKSARDALDEEEVADEVEPDATLYEHQLCAFSFLGRSSAHIATAAPALAGLLGTKLDAFTQTLTAEQAPDFAQLAVMSEELHWAMLISGYYLTDTDVGERDVVPAEIMHVSATVPEGSEAADPFVQMPTKMLVRC